MIGRSLGTALVGVSLLTASAAPAHACHFFDRLCGKPTTTFYAPAPVMAAPACCPQQQVVNYVPQTAFRTVIVNRPVVSFAAQPGCDACGRPTTVMRPVTTMVAQQQLVPYTTFRPVVSTVASPCCGATPTAVSYAPAPTVSVAPAPAPAPCCSPASTSTVISTPAVTTPVPSLSTPPAGQPGSSLQSLQPTPDPTLNGGGGGETFAPGNNGATNGGASNGANGADTSPYSSSYGNGSGNEPQSRVLMPPYKGSSSSLPEQPRGLDPQSGDRVTSIPLQPSQSLRQAARVVPAKFVQPSRQPLDESGWEAAD